MVETRQRSAVWANPVPVGGVLVLLLVAAVGSIVALERYSATKYRMSVQTFHMGFEAQNLNLLALAALSDTDAMNVRGSVSKRSVDQDLANLDALLTEVNENLILVPAQIRQDTVLYVAGIERVHALIDHRDPLAFETLSSLTNGGDSQLVRLAADVDTVGNQELEVANRASYQTSAASIGIVALALGLGALVYRGFRRGRRRIEAAEAERETLRRSEARFRPLVHHSADVIAIADSQGRFVYTSPAVERVFGLRDAEHPEGTLFSQVHPDDSGLLRSLYDEVLARPNYTAAAGLRMMTTNGDVRHCELACTNLQNDPGIAGIVLNIRDVTDRKAMEEQLRRLAFSDSLTNLANRLRFVDRLEHALVRARRGRRKTVSVLYLDLDHFKAVNDEHGHSVGDALLNEVAARILTCIRAGDTAARLGGDEFAILLEETSSPAEAHSVADRLLQELSRTFTLASRQLSLSASIGIVVADPAATDAEEVIRNADIAMYDAKENGRGRAEVYEQGMHANVVERGRLIGELNQGVDGDEFVIQYQPTVDLGTEQTAGFEALVRWNHPRHGLLLPSEFIGLAEETGVILKLGELVLGRACHQLGDWQKQYPAGRDLTISVNVSAKQIQRAGFVEVVERALSDSGIEPRCLVLELTESVLVEQPQRAIDTLWRLKNLGVRLALDDFGTGYSSLSYLRRFPIDILKIDRSFVDSLGTNSKDRMLVHTVIELGRALDMEIVAEGIESQDQLQWLTTAHCGIGQGYLFARPLDPDAAVALIAKMGRTGGDAGGGVVHDSAEADVA